MTMIDESGFQALLGEVAAFVRGPGQEYAAENAADIEGARQLTLYAARQWESGDQRADTLSSMAKLTAVDMLTRVTDKALQVHGGIGYRESSPIERVYRDARAQRFEEGANEIQKTVIAREVLGSLR